MNVLRFQIPLIAMVIVLLTGLLSPTASAREPRVLEVPFYREAIALPPEVMGDLVNTLMALANGYPDFVKRNPRIQTNALAVAVAIDPEVSIDSKGTDGEDIPQALLKRLWETADRIHSTAHSNDERLLALYLMAVVDSGVAEGEPSYKRMRGLLRQEKFPGWQEITGEKPTTAKREAGGQKNKPK